MDLWGRRRAGSRSLWALALLVLAPTARATEADVVAAAQAVADSVWADAEVRVIRLSGGAETAPPPLRVRFREANPPRVSAEVETLSDGEWTSAGWAFLEVAVFDTVAVLTRDVARGEPVADALRWARADVTRLPDALGAAFADGTATRSLRAGTVLTSRHVEAPAAVESGEPVRIRYARGAVVVVLDCQARERGAVGDVVRATCSGTRASYRVRLTAPGEGDWAATL
ncbi:flagellar basal body P-ring formation chaperone FlgA [Rubrivirga sp.]|uniref:flagellar basal body P-ring formation chaperone FlgA n=1 Tax=Rubrivirga sp. TaxID=1885344 RepID=UPI003B52D68D